MKMDTIVVPTDFSADAERALEVAADLARSANGRIFLLHAYKADFTSAGAAHGAGVILPEGFYVEYRDQTTEQIERLARETSAKEGVPVEGISIPQPAWMAILDEAERLDADLIVMGTRGLTGIKHVTLGSNAERVVRKAHCPVLTVKASEGDE